MLGFIAIIISVIAIIKASDKKAEIEYLRRRVEGLEQGNISPVQASAQIASTSPVAVPVSQPVMVQRKPEEPNVFVTWFSDNWLLKIGVLLVLIGFGWFLSYAFINDWVGPVGKVTIGFLIGGGICIWATQRIRKYRVQGTMLLALGSAITMITTLAGRSVYELYGEGATLFLILIVALYVALVGWVNNSQKISIYAVVIGLCVPMFVYDAFPTLEFLISYLLIVSVATVWVAAVKNWREVNAVALTGTFIYGLAMMFDGESQNYFVLFISNVLSVMYFIVSILGITRSKEDISKADVYVAIVNSIFILGVTLSYVVEELRSLALAVWMLVFAFGAYYVFKKINRETFFYVYSLIAATFLAVATSIELDAQDVIFAFAFEATAISIASYMVTRKLSVGYMMSVFMFVPTVMALPSYITNSWSSGIWHKDFAIIVSVSALLMLLGIYYYFSRDEYGPEDPKLPKVYIAHLITGSAMALLLWWVVLEALLKDYASSVTVALTTYMILGLVLYIRGRDSNVIAVKYYGGTLIVLVILRLIFVEAWIMDLGPRIVMFILIGVLLMATAFLKQSGKKVVVDNQVQK